MKFLIRLLFPIYVYLFFYPLAIAWMVLSSISAIIFALAFGQKAGSFVGRIWAQGNCLLSFVWVTVSGKENLSKTQSYVFVANHASAYDIYSMYGYLGRDIRWMMKKELMRTPFLGYACKKVGHISVDRSNAVKAAETIETAGKLLHEGASVIFFPEGSRTRTGKIGPFKRGAFVTAQEIGLPVVPVTINGSFDIMKPGNTTFYPGCISLTIHPPLVLKSKNREELQDEMNKVRDIIDKGLK